MRHVLLSCLFLGLFAVVFVQASANAQNAADSKKKESTVSVNCNDAVDDNNGGSYCDKDLTNSGTCSNALADKEIRNAIDANVCCTGKSTDLTYLYGGTPYDPCSEVSVSGSGAHRKLKVNVDKTRDCSGVSCREFPPTAMEGLDTAIGAVTCVQ